MFGLVVLFLADEMKLFCNDAFNGVEHSGIVCREAALYDDAPTTALHCVDMVFMGSFFLQTWADLLPKLLFPFTRLLFKKIWFVRLDRGLSFLVKKDHVLVENGLAGLKVSRRDKAKNLQGVRSKKQISSF